MLDQIRGLLSSTEPGSPADSSSSLAPDNSPETLKPLLPVSHYSDAVPWVNLQNVNLEFPLERYIENDQSPLPATSDREEYYGDRHYDYWLSGLVDYLHTKQVLAKYGKDSDQPATILDFGCASGRVMRHFLSHDPGIVMWGADINRRHIEWILRFLEATPRVFQNTSLPFLPLEDNSLDLVYAFSVFTHIDEFELAWLCELRRVLKPGGLACLSLVTDHTWSILRPEHSLYGNLLAVNELIEEYDVTPEFLSGPFPSERVVFQWPGVASMVHCTLFHSTEYILSTWGRFLDVVEIVREGSDLQDVVILRKAS